MQNKNQPVIANANNPFVIARSTATKQSNQNKKSCHSRTLLSGIYNARCCKIKGIPLLNRYVEDPRVLRTAKSGMTFNLIPPLPAFGHPLPPGARKTAPGFTLIELLVVVLIIGILAAVAVPQYQKAVLKSRLVQGIIVVKTIANAQENYYLANGEYSSSLTNLDISFQCQTTKYICTIDETLVSLSPRSSGGISIGYRPLHREEVPELQGRFYCATPIDNTLGIQLCKSYGEKIQTDGTPGWVSYEIK